MVNRDFPHGCASENDDDNAPLQKSPGSADSGEAIDHRFRELIAQEDLVNALDPREVARLEGLVGGPRDYAVPADDEEFSAPTPPAFRRLLDRRTTGWLIFVLLILLLMILGIAQVQLSAPLLVLVGIGFGASLALALIPTKHQP